jgi:hypothetical protein
MDTRFLYNIVITIRQYHINTFFQNIPSDSERKTPAEILQHGHTRFDAKASVDAGLSISLDLLVLGSEPNISAKEMWLTSYRKGAPIK